MSLARILAFMLAGCALFASSAVAAQSVKLHVAFDPDIAGQRTTIELSLRISGPGGAPPAPVRSIDVGLPANIGIATTTLGESNCNAADLFSGGLDGCSANARVGFGDATAVVPVGSHDVTEDASLNALMGPPVEDHLEVLFYVEALDPVFAQLVLPSVVQEATRPFGEQLDTSFPVVPAWPEGPDLALETFNSTIGPLHLTYHRQVDGRTISYKPHGIRLPQRCPVDGYPFRAILSFQDDTRVTANYHVPCPSR